MPTWRRSRFFGTDVVLITTVATIILALGLTESRSGSPAIRQMEATVLREPLTGARPVPPGFLELSLEYSALDSYAGENPDAINPVFEQLVRNLSPGQAPVIRIGGDSAGWTWWPVSGYARPPA